MGGAVQSARAGACEDGHEWERRRNKAVGTLRIRRMTGGGTEGGRTDRELRLGMDKEMYCREAHRRTVFTVLYIQYI